MARVVFDGVYTFVSYNFPDMYIRHRNGIGEIGPRDTDLERQDSSFVIKHLDPLAPAFVISFQSVNYPTHYLRHQNSEIRLHPRVNDLQYYNDASFYARPGLADSRYMSFESHSVTGFIRHRNGRLYVELGRGDLFRADATFLPVRLG